jgi:hypothetical protein
VDQLVEPPVDDFWPEDESDFEEPDFDEPDFDEPESDESDDDAEAAVVEDDEESLEPLPAGTVDDEPVRLSVR